MKNLKIINPSICSGVLTEVGVSRQNEKAIQITFTGYNINQVVAIDYDTANDLRLFLSDILGYTEADTEDDFDYKKMYARSIGAEE